MVQEKADIRSRKLMTLILYCRSVISRPQNSFPVERRSPLDMGVNRAMHIVLY